VPRPERLLFPEEFPDFQISLDPDVYNSIVRVAMSDRDTTVTVIGTLAPVYKTVRDTQQKKMP
jgi:hypothetical protein